jgi:A/G-specific adenine glycosylase
MHATFRKRLLDWYQREGRDLPWRSTSDPYAIWVSEVMLQQTRVATVLPYYARWMQRFPTIGVLAAAPESEVLRAWSGLGYYSRARNLHRAARQIGSAFPSTYESIRDLPGVGDYTAAAVASIGFREPRAAVDGNVLRVLARVTNDAGNIGSPTTRRRLTHVAEELLDRRHPGEFNQALMELGAIICVPKSPRCESCPIVQSCEARRLARHDELPVKLRRSQAARVHRTLLVVRRGRQMLFWIRDGFWELPEPAHLPEAVIQHTIGEFRHCITNHIYTFKVVQATLHFNPTDLRWLPPLRVKYLFSTTTCKALRVAGVDGF